jgi:hypothetical protein
LGPPSPLIISALAISSARDALEGAALAILAAPLLAVLAVDESILTGSRESEAGNRARELETSHTDRETLFLRRIALHGRSPVSLLWLKVPIHEPRDELERLAGIAGGHHVAGALHGRKRQAAAQIELCEEASHLETEAEYRG